MKRVFAAMLLTAFAAACGNNSPTGPSGTTPTSVTGAWAGNSSDSSNSMGTGSMMGAGRSGRDDVAAHPERVHGDGLDELLRHAGRQARFFVGHDVRG